MRSPVIGLDEALGFCVDPTECLGIHLVLKSFSSRALGYAIVQLFQARVLPIILEIAEQAARGPDGHHQNAFVEYDVTYLVPDLQFQCIPDGFRKRSLSAAIDARFQYKSLPCATGSDITCAKLASSHRTSSGFCPNLKDCR